MSRRMNQTYFERSEFDVNVILILTVELNMNESEQLNFNTDLTYFFQLFRYALMGALILFSKASIVVVDMFLYKRELKYS